MLWAGEEGGGLNLLYMHPFLKKVMFIGYYCCLYCYCV